MQLPHDMRIENTCFFTGHRFLSEEQKILLYPALSQCILQMADNGIRYFCNGGAIGFDLFSAQTVVLLQRHHKELQLIMALPCRNQTDKWMNHGASGVENIRLYHEVKSHAAAVIYVRDFYEPGCMRERNQFMVDHSCHCITYWNGSAQGGTAQTVRMAKRAGLPIWNLYPGEQLTLEP